MEVLISILLGFTIVILLVAGLIFAMMLRGISSHISTIEKLSERSITNDATTKRLADTASAIQEGIAKTQQGLAAIQAQSQARHDIESRTANSIHRLESVIAGTQAKGAAGENIIEVVFAQLPPDWQVRDFKVGNKTVEFGLRLPNNLVLPIDSKWAATDLLESFLAADDIKEKQVLKPQIEKAVLSKVKEVRKYLNPDITVDFGVAAIPDAVFDLCTRVQAESLRMNVVVISYSLFVPYLLLVFQTTLKTSQNIDMQRLLSYSESAQMNITEVQDEIEGRLSRAITMLNNSRDDIRTLISKVSAGLVSLQINSSTDMVQPQDEEQQHQQSTPRI